MWFFSEEAKNWVEFRAGAKENLGKLIFVIFQNILYYSCQFHQRFKSSFYACRSQKRKKIQLSHQFLFTLLGSARDPNVDEIEPRFLS